MTSIKTAVSIQESLFEEADALARRMKVSRSRLFAVALEEYLRRERDRELIRRISEAYEDYPDSSELNQRRAMRRLQREVVEGEW